MAEKSSSKQTDADKQGIRNPYVSEDTNIDDEKYADLDATKVIGKYAMQPDPNDDRPGPPEPNVPKGVNEAPADDEPGTPAIPVADAGTKSEPANNT